ncbi:carboxypeptidase-like regulatory domain-containing protein [Neolewinella persica]|uniref:carboxypeptidase-like regulatory domain-containing protein n=1 Tax=Neolewinella persica TaxID=70998 RepID=UPI00037AE594|nr:carboxypeptidase-like regulatory domain-containing protein [Neolewinella persica]
MLTDASTGAPLAYAYVFLEKDQQYGVISNERGEYRITLDSTQMNDRLVFSLMSYQPHYLKLQELEPEQTHYNLQLNTSFLELQEIVILSDIGLRAIVEKALVNIPNIYGAEDYLLKGYYRKYDIDNQEYAQLVEAMVTIKDEAYDDPERGVKAWIDEFRMSDYTGSGQERFQTRKRNQPSLLGGYADIRNGVRMHYLHWVTSIAGGHDNLRFTNRGEYLEGKDTLIRIAYNWDLKASGANAEQQARLSAYFTGEVLINRTDNAILQNTQGNAGKGFFNDATYQKTKGKYYLKQLVQGGEFRYDSLQQSHFYQSILYVTDVIIEAKQKKAYRKGNRINSELTLEEVRTPYNPKFWSANPMMVKLPAPAALEIGLSRLRSLEEQFRENARKVVEE